MNEKAVSSKCQFSIRILLLFIIFLSLFSCYSITFKMTIHKIPASLHNPRSETPHLGSSREDKGLIKRGLWD